MKNRYYTIKIENLVNMLAILLLNRMSARRRRLAKPVIKTVISTIKSEQKPVIEYCRTCLSTNDLESIFSNKEMAQRRSEELMLVTGLEITMHDDLSQKICTRCIATMNMALQFRRNSKKTENALRNMLKDTKLDLKMEYGSSFEYNESDEDFQTNNYNYDENIQSNSKVKKGSIKRKRTATPNPGPFRCDTCKKEFEMECTYRAHMRAHKFYCVCESCGKRCRNNYSLEQHKRARHGLARIHKCAYCDYTPATKEALTIHERRHTGERPYICDHCGATFHRRAILVQHLPIHSSEKKFQCDKCPMRLKSRQFLHSHKYSAHNEKRHRYLCPVCKHGFDKPYIVRNHARRVHGLPEEQLGPIVRIQL